MEKFILVLLGTSLAIAFMLILMGVSEIMTFPETQKGGMSKVWTYFMLIVMWIFSVFGIGAIIGLIT